MPTARPLAASTCANGCATRRSPASIAGHVVLGLRARATGSHVPHRVVLGGGEQVGDVAVGGRLEHDVAAGERDGLDPGHALSAGPSGRASSGRGAWRAARVPALRIRVGRRGGLRGQLLRLLGGDRQHHGALEDPRDLGRVDEAAPVGRVDHDPVEDVLAGVVLHAPDGPDLHAVGRAHGRPAREHLVADGVTVVVHHAVQFLRRPAAAPRRGRRPRRPPCARAASAAPPRPPPGSRRP